MKKIFLFAVVLLCALTSCKKDNMKDVYADFVDSVNNCESYELQGEMEIKRNNESDRLNYIISKGIDIIEESMK